MHQNNIKTRKTIHKSWRYNIFAIVSIRLINKSIDT